MPLSAAGQLTPVSDHYILNPLTINPACAGSSGALNIAAFYRRQWVGVPGAPETMTFAADALLWNSKVGLGIVIVNDKIGVTKETSFKTDYSYKVSFGKGGISFGLGAGLKLTNTDWSKLVVLDPGDEYYLLASRVFLVPDFSFGLYYTNLKYYLGISIPNLISYKYNFEKEGYSLKMNPHKYLYLLNSGYVIDLGAKTKFLPSVLIYYLQGEKMQIDMNVHFSFLDRLWIGGSYRSARSVAGLFQFAVNNQFKVAYSYDFDFSKLGRYSNGSHELMIRYEFRYKINVISPLVF
jgi:type IX secretion system PorP/SprF family membrane protein